MWSTKHNGPLVYFSLHGLTVEPVLSKPGCWPDNLEDAFFLPAKWRRSQETSFEGNSELFRNPVPMRAVPLFRHEVLGLGANSRTSRTKMFGETRRTRQKREADGAALHFPQTNGPLRGRLQRPLATKGEVDCLRRARVVIEVWQPCGGHWGGAEYTMACLSPVPVLRLEEGMLVVELEGTLNR